MTAVRVAWILVALGISVGAEAQNPQRVDGSWAGVMEREGASVNVRFDFHTVAGAVTGRFTSETRRVLDYPLNTVSYAAPKVHWTLGDSLAFDGELSGKTLTGTFLDGKDQGTFSLHLSQPDSQPYRREDVTFRNGDVVLAGTLLRPRAAGLHAGVVFLHGSGPESRWGTNLFLADRFARAGIAALVFDKRGVGQSTGDWKTIDYTELAEDYLGAVRFLQKQTGVNPKQVGIYGHSQGGTISPLLTSRPGAVAFVIAAAAVGTGPLYTSEAYRTRNDLVAGGMTEPDLARAMDFYNLWIDVMRTGQGLDAYERALAQARTEKWFEPLGIPPRSDWIWKWYPPVGNFNPLPLWEKVKVPVLLIYGERDRNTQVDPSLAGISQALRVAGNADFTPVIIPGAVHNLTIQWEPGQPFFWWHAAPGYSDLLTSWVRLRFAGKN